MECDRVPARFSGFCRLGKGAPVGALECKVSTTRRQHCLHRDTSPPTAQGLANPADSTSSGKSLATTVTSTPRSASCLAIDKPKTVVGQRSTSTAASLDSARRESTLRTKAAICPLGALRSVPRKRVGEMTHSPPAPSTPTFCFGSLISKMIDTVSRQKTQSHGDVSTGKRYTHHPGYQDPTTRAISHNDRVRCGGPDKSDGDLRLNEGVLR